MRPRVFRGVADKWFVEFLDSELRHTVFHLCDSHEHALRVANRIARRQARESA